MEKMNLTKMFLFLVTIFRTKYEQLLEAYNGGHCAMVLIKNVITTTKGYQYLKAQHYTILIKVMDEFELTFCNYTTNNQVFNLYLKR
jgi:hypothetical protein